MFKSLYRLQQHPDRLLPEAVLTGKGAIVMLFIFLGEQLTATLLSLLTRVYHLPLDLTDINLIANGGAFLMMLLFFGGFFISSLKSYFKEYKAIYLWLPIACYFVTIFANITIQTLLAIIRGEIQNTSNNELVLQILQQKPFQTVLLTVLIAPVIEEAVFRAALSRSLTASDKNWVKVMGFLLSIFVFSFLHVYQYVFFATDASGAVYLTFNLNEFLSILVYIPMSVALVLCSYFGRNFWCSVSCHMLTNGVAVLLMLLAGNLFQ